MTPGQGVDGPSVAHDLVLDEALQAVSAAPSGEASVVDAEGKPIGSVSLKQIINAMARPAEEGDQEARYR